MNVKLCLSFLLLSAFATAISAANLDQECSDTSDCSTTEHAECVDVNGTKFCKCANGYRADATNCVAFKNLDAVCTASSECPTHAECADDNGTKKCKCSSGFKAVSTSCVAIKNLDAVCTASIECPTNAECVDDTGGKKCKCSSGFKAVSTNCVAIKRLGDGCTGDAECSDVEHAVCTNTVCACAAKYAPNKGVCNQVVTGGKCIPTINCTSIANAECSNANPQVCVCKAGSTENNGACNIAVSQTTCSEGGKQCDSITNAECDTTSTVPKCKCKSGFTENSNKCQEKSGAVSTTTFIGIVFFPLMVLLFDKLIM